MGIKIKYETYTYIFYLELYSFSENYDPVIFYSFVRYRKLRIYILIENKSL